MSTLHSLVSPSNFERRMLCPGSLNAEKDLPDTYSKYAEEGRLLHEQTAMFISTIKTRGYDRKETEFNPDLTNDQNLAVIDAATYFLSLIQSPRYLDQVLYESLEKTYDLSFIYPGMKGTADSVLIARNQGTGNIDVHVIDYKFGKGVAVQAYENYQLILYYLGVIKNPEVKAIIKGEKISVRLHIVQPFIKNSVWILSDDEILEISNLEFYLDVVNKCFSPNARRIANKKACQFCKAKATCPALAKTLPNPDIDFFALEDSEIAAIYDKRDLVTMYLTALEEYITTRISNGGFTGYTLMAKMSNRKWNNDALIELTNILGDGALETTTKLIGIGKTEKLLGKDAHIINKLVTKEVTGVEIVKTSIQK